MWNLVWCHVKFWLKQSWAVFLYRLLLKRIDHNRSIDHYLCVLLAWTVNTFMKWLHCFYIAPVYPSKKKINKENDQGGYIAYELFIWVLTDVHLKMILENSQSHQTAERWCVTAKNNKSILSVKHKQRAAAERMSFLAVGKIVNIPVRVVLFVQVCACVRVFWFRLLSTVTSSQLFLLRTEQVEPMSLSLPL